MTGLLTSAALGARTMPPCGPTLTIDLDSDPGSWATAIAHTPGLARQCDPDFLETYERPAAGEGSHLDD